MICRFGHHFPSLSYRKIQTRIIGYDELNFDVSKRHIIVPLFYFFIILIFLDLIYPRILRMVPDPVGIELPKLWMKITFIRRIMKSTTKNLRMKTEQMTSKLFRKNKRLFWTLKFSVFLTRESKIHKKTQHKSQKMEIIF